MQIRTESKKKFPIEQQMALALSHTNNNCMSRTKKRREEK